MARCLLDASALMAYLLSEQGGEDVERLFPAQMSIINVIEVVMKMVKEHAYDRDAVLRQIHVLVDVVDFKMKYLETATKLPSRVGKRSISLGDRVCLATAIVRDIPVYTADRIWKELNVGADVRLIR